MDNSNEFWEDLYFEIKDIKSPISTLGEDNPLIGTGNKDADIMFIGDDPDLYENEDLKVSPGSSGEFLIKLCDLEEIRPDMYYITTLTKHNCKYRDLLVRDRAVLKELLDTQIALIDPEIIVALGSEVAQVLSGNEIDFTSNRGKFNDWIGGKKLLYTYDVNFVKKSRIDSGKKSKVALEFWNDLKTIKKEIEEINSRS